MFSFDATTKLVNLLAGDLDGALYKRCPIKFGYVRPHAL